MCKKMIFLMSFVLVLSLASNVQALFDTWTAKEESRGWRVVAMSADGTIQTATARDDGAYSGGLYVSRDSGDTWAAAVDVELGVYWRAVAMSANGAIQTAAVANGHIYVSEDSGDTWAATEAPSMNWDAVAMSEDGTIQTATVYAGGYIYVSTNSGDTWTAKGPSKNWAGVAMSANGAIQTAVVKGGYIYVSMDSGNTWTANGSTYGYWADVAMSADGAIQTAVVYNRQIYVSTDTGNTWTAKDEDRKWMNVAMSADGRIQTAVAQSGQIYVSTDSGNTWTAKESNRDWRGIAMSADGTIQTATAHNEQIYVCSEDPGLVGLNPIPADGSTVPVSLDLLQWTLPEPNRPGDVVICDVYFGTNPSIWENPKIVDKKAVESVSIGPLTIDTMYYWAVCLYDPSIGEGYDYPYCWSDPFTFTVGNVPPIVNAGDDVETWLANGERIVQLDGSASDDGKIEPLSYEWTVTAEPNELNPAVFSDPFVLDPTVTVKEIGSYILRLEAYDGEHTVTDTMQIVLYTDSCEHASNQEGFEWLTGDVNHDCKVDFRDFASFAATWLDENYSTE